MLFIIYLMLLMTFINPRDIRKILLIKLKGIGDVVLSTIVFDNLRETFPDAAIDFLTEPPSLPLLEPLPFINQVILFRKKEPASALKLIWEVMKQRYDLVIDMYSNPRTALVTYLSGARYRAGFPYRGRAYSYNLQGPIERGSMHAALLHLELLKYIGIPADKKKLYFGLTDKDIDFARNFFFSIFAPEDKVIAISPSGGWDSKKCEADKFVEFALHIRQAFKVKFLLVWGPGDKEDAETISRGLGVDAVLSPNSTIREMGALMKNCIAVIANDSGPMHIGAALGVPVLSIHGPTIPQFQGPFGDKNMFVRFDELDCIGCNLLNCPKKHECFRGLTRERMLELFNQLLVNYNIILPINEKRRDIF